MKLLFVLDNYWPHVGGVENAFRNLCEGMAERGHSVTVVTHRPKGTASREYLNGVTIVRLSCLYSRYLFSLVALAWVVFRRPHADIIQTTTFNGAPAAWVASRLRKIPIVMTVNETWIGKWQVNTTFSKPKAIIHEILERAVFGFPFDVYVAISNATAEQLRAVVSRARERVQTIYYGFDPSHWRSDANAAQAVRERLGLIGRFVILGYGRPGTSKGFEWFVDAAPAIEKAIPSAAIVLILSEDTQYRRELTDLKQRAEGRVLFLPQQPFAELPAYLKAANCIVVPSLAEGFGYTTLEAVAAGVPVVASRVGSIPEVIGGRYLLVEPRDVGELVEALVAVSDNRISQAPERSFPWNVSLDAYEQLYKRLSGNLRPAL